MGKATMAERLTDHSDRVRQLFDAKAFTWSQKYASGGRLTSRMARISAAVKGHVQAGGSVLDLGCGTGDIARTLAAAGMQLTGCDISSEMLCRASEQDVRDAVNWVQLNTGWRTLPFRTAIFDAIVAVSVLEYVENPHAVLWECARVLRPGGILVCTVPDPAHPVRWLEWVIGLSADAPRIAAAANSWPRLGNYLAYLRISRNRHSAGWWTAAAAQCHLQDISSPTDDVGHAPLRLLSFQATK
jgi:ubiquinone/menaquinone biosynthesis C-methylase UbiE